MGICKRTISDPLLRVFLDRYNLNLLSKPRENANLGDLYIHSNGRVSTPGSIEDFLIPKLRVPKGLLNEQMGDVYGQITNSISFSYGLALLEGFFAGLGVSELLGEVEANYSIKNVHTFQFSFKEALRDSINVGLMGSQLIQKKFDDRNALVNPGNQYHLVTGLAKSASITVAAKTREGKTVDLGLKIVKVINTKGNVEIEQETNGGITYMGKKKLVFGVELYELKFDEKRKKMKMLIPPGAVQILSAKDENEHQLLKPSFIGNPEGNAFIDLE